MAASREFFIDDSSQKKRSDRRIHYLIVLGVLVVGIGSGIGIGWAIRGDSSSDDAAQEDVKLDFDPFEFIDATTDNNTIQG